MEQSQFDNDGNLIEGDKVNLPLGTGLQMRDQFALGALAGMLASNAQYFDGASDPKRFSNLAYKYADAMLVARSVKP